MPVPDQPRSLVARLAHARRPQGRAGNRRAKADAALKTDPFNFGFELRPYQQRAIQALEAALADGKRAMLAAMATGTGKTKLAIDFLYRVLASGRF
jgi:type I restriction enzyme R subunit